MKENKNKNDCLITMEDAINILKAICLKHDCRIEKCPLEDYCGSNICEWLDDEEV